MFGKLILNIVRRQAEKESIDQAAKMPSASINSQEMAGERKVSWGEYRDLVDRFEALCRHLKVRVDRPYGYQVKKTGDFGIETSGQTTAPSTPI